LYCLRKIRALKAALSKAGFEFARTRSSHERWIHLLLPEFSIAVARRDGDDAKLHLEKLGKTALQALKAKELTKSRYRVNIVWSEEDSCYLAELPEFAHELQRYFTHEDTYQEAIANAQEVLERLVEDYEA
jgi:antitoxin HicB